MIATHRRHERPYGDLRMAWSQERYVEHFVDSFSAGRDPKLHTIPIDQTATRAPRDGVLRSSTPDAGLPRAVRRGPRPTQPTMPDSADPRRYSERSADAAGARAVQPAGMSAPNTVIATPASPRTTNWAV